MSKGSKQRPREVSMKTYTEAWDRVFGLKRFTMSKTVRDMTRRAKAVTWTPGAGPTRSVKQ